MRVATWVHSIEFVPKHSSEETVLWRRDNPEPSGDTRRRMSGSYYLINSVTQRDSGNYILKDRDGMILSRKTVEVVAKKETRSLSSGERLSITFDLEPNSCNIYFAPQGGYETVIVYKGELQQLSGCSGIELLNPCGISQDAVQTSCGGRFEVRDHNDDEALVVSVEVAPQVSFSYVLYGGGAFAFLFLSCCLKNCCAAKSSREKSRPEPRAAAAEEPADLPEYDHEPAGGRPHHPSETLHPAQPLSAPTGPLIHSPPTNVPPAYSEVIDPAEQVDPQTVLMNPDYEPRFELKGFTSNSPLSSDSPHHEVYTSDKLNFL
ncbi:uncharacterized protein LOC119409002 [Nematolebias whitei]|uniref:uncharacterized protein LOC119409002 n=1 Tax=Nematolebias whitei TaxID=451745 RepID=UPI00189BBE3D|nr:uncharacterized protein LOC119409002 [Nematolebias whitei]